MKEDISEIMGFLCRWALLAVVALTAGAGVYASMAATAEVVKGPTMDLVFADGIDAASGPRGFVLTSGKVSLKTRHFIVGQAGEGKKLLAHNRSVNLSRAKLSPGVNEIEVWGIPYDSLAFRKYPASCLGDLTGRRVFMVDMRAANAWAIDDATMLTACLDEMARRGAVVMFFMGSLEKFTEMRARLNLIDVPSAMLFRQSAKPSPQWMALRTAQLLQSESNAASFCLTTNQQNLAEQFAARNIAAYLVAPAGDAPASKVNLSVIPTMKDFQRRLARLLR